MKGYLYLVLFFFCSIQSFADVENFAWTGILGSSIRYRLEIQINNIDAVAGQMTYYRKDNTTRVIPVFGYVDRDGDNPRYSIYIREYNGVKVCGYLCVEMQGKHFKDGRWSFDGKELAMNTVQNVSVKPGIRFFHPCKTIKDAVGSYSFSYDSGNAMMPEYGGSCDLTNNNGKIGWSISQVTPNIAQGEGSSKFENCQFDGHVYNYKFSAYVDEQFVYVWRTNPEDGLTSDFGAGASLDGIYVKKDFYKLTMNDLVDWTVGLNENEREQLKTMDLLTSATDAAMSCVNGDDATELVDLLNADPLPIKAADLLSFTKVRSYQFNNGYLTTYPYFSCKLSQEVKSITFKKTAGSQRKMGALSRWSDFYLAFNGYYFHNDDPIQYDAEHHVLGLMKKVSDKKYIIIFQRNKFGAYEVYELSK